MTTCDNFWKRWAPLLVNILNTSPFDDANQWQLLESWAPPNEYSLYTFYSTIQTCDKSLKRWAPPKETILYTLHFRRWRPVRTPGKGGHIPQDNHCVLLVCALYTTTTTPATTSGKGISMWLSCKRWADQTEELKDAVNQHLAWVYFFRETPPSVQHRKFIFRMRFVVRYLSVSQRRKIKIKTLFFYPGEARCLPHPAFCSARVPESVTRHDRGVARKETHGKLVFSPPLLLQNGFT